jgi:Cof subfamily protein (haloacid dehalogenase superfamily)
MSGNHRIRLAAMDLDGTLVVGGHHIPPRCAEAIAEARRQGVHIILATGRMHHSAVDFAERLGLGDEPLISYNGAMVRRAQSGETILHDPVPAEATVEILEYCIENRANIHYYVDDVMYVLKVDHWARSYLERTGSAPVPAGDVRRLPGKEPTKVLIIDRPERAERYLAEAQGRFAGRVYVTRSLPEYIEFLSVNASKGRALRAVAEHLGIPMEQTMGLGDMINDLPLIEEAGLGIAMHHAPESVRQVADHVTGPGDEGVAEAIEKFVLSQSLTPIPSPSGRGVKG